MIYYITIGILVLSAYGLGDIFSKKFGDSPHWSTLIYASACYLTSSFIWLYCVCKGMDISRGSILFGIASAMAGLFVGCVVYHEPLKLMDWVGISLGVVSITILSLK